MIGRKLAHYEVLAKIGEGGMGEVFLARDPQLDREVAIKVLPESVALSPHRRTRFEREARTLAALDHPGIATVYGLHEDDGIHFMAMERIPGEDLAVRIGAARPSVHEAIELAIQLSEALQAAHEQGIVHRDLKPSNIMVTPEGRVKVLDFGLSRSAPPTDSADRPVPADSPTRTVPLTAVHAIVGTAAYMSPEQADGRAVDTRTDIWAFGVVLYELLTGVRPFGGSSATHQLAAVLRDEPDWSALPSDTPPAVRRLLRRCLAKDPAERLHHIADARLELLDARDGASADVTGKEQLVPWWGLILVVALTATALGWWLGSTPSEAPNRPLRRFEIVAPGLVSSQERPPVIAPAGDRIAYRAGDRLMVQDLNTLLPREVAELEASTPFFFSPDSEWLAFGRGDQLWKVRHTGGPAQPLCELPGPGPMIGGAWGPEGRIAISIRWGAIHVLPEQGGAPRVLVEPDAENRDFRHLCWLDDGETILAVPHPMATHIANLAKIVAIRGGTFRVVLEEDFAGLHSHGLAWSPTGHLVFQQAWMNEGIWAIGFDADRLEATGAPFLIDPDGVHPSVARDGTLVHRRKEPEQDYRLVWVDRGGKVEETVVSGVTELANPAASPDGTRVAYSAQSDEQSSIFVQRLPDGPPLRLTFEGNWGYPEWSPDGQRILYSSGQSAEIRFADGTGEIVPIGGAKRPSFAPDGETLLYHFPREDSEIDDVWLRPLDESGGPILVIDGPAEERARVSPQGNYIAYAADETGDDEIYLSRFPSGDGKWQITRDGGTDVRWSGTGDELFYVASDRTIFAVPVTHEPELRIGHPVRLFGRDELEGIVPGRGYDVSEDGERILLVLRGEITARTPSLVVVESWWEER